MVSSTGKLGIVVSSARYKRDIHDMGDGSSKLMKLRPVTFRYKNDPAGRAAVWAGGRGGGGSLSGLVVRGTKGEIESLQYQELFPMLLNEVEASAANVGRYRPASSPRNFVSSAHNPCSWRNSKLRTRAYGIPWFSRMRQWRHAWTGWRRVRSRRRWLAAEERGNLTAPACGSRRLFSRCCGRCGSSRHIRKAAARKHAALSLFQRAMHAGSGSVGAPWRS